jgi:hypothetical protein
VRRTAAVLVLFLTAQVARADHAGMSNADEIGMAVAAFVLFVFPVLLLGSLVLYLVVRAVIRHTKRPASDVIDLTRTTPPPGN